MALDAAPLMPPLPAITVLLGYGALGVVLGLVHFRLLRWNTARYLAGRRDALLWQLLRVAATALALLLIGRAGVWPLLAAFAGLLLGRQWLLKSTRAAR